MDLLQSMLEDRIISIIRGVSSSYIVNTVEALKKGGIRFVEVTFRPDDEIASKDTLRSIDILTSKFLGCMYIGAGTVTSVEQVETAANAGAQFIISPNTNVNVIKRTKELGLCSIPGAYTPSEALCAWEAGADIVKIFPARQLNPDYFKDVKASLSQLKLAAVGGVSKENIVSFLESGADLVGIGSNLINFERVAANDWSGIERDAKAYVSAVMRSELDE